MTCHKALAERLIEITSKPLQNYKRTIVQGPCDPYYGIPDYNYTLHRYNWDISPNKRLVLVTKEQETLVPEDYDIESLKVIYHVGGWFPFFRSSLKHKTFPVSVLNTIRQFAYDGIKAFRMKESAEIAARDEIEAQTACQHALRQLS